MAYAPPPSSSLNFALARGPYIAPTVSQLDIDLALDGVSRPPRSIVPGVIASFGISFGSRAAEVDTAVAAPFQSARQLSITRSLNASQASLLRGVELSAGFSASEERDRATSSLWQAGQARERAASARYADAPARDIGPMVSPWASPSLQIDRRAQSSFLVKTPWKDRESRQPYFHSKLYAPIWRRTDNLPARLAVYETGLANFELSVASASTLNQPHDLGGVFAVNPSQPIDLAHEALHGQASAADLRQALPWGPGGARDTTLDFTYVTYSGPVGEPGDTFLIPTLRLYIVTNSAQIVRVADGRDVPAQQATIATNSDQFTWSLSATLGNAAARALLEGQGGEPVEADVIINGNSWRFLIDQWSEQEAWNESTHTVRGRSLSASLAAPYATSRDYQEASGLLAQQLAAQELPPGWSLDWSMPDWFVPAGAWEYQGLTPIQAIGRIAAAASGYVQSSPSTSDLRVLPLYPAAPWLLSAETPDFQIPRAVMVQRSARKDPGSPVNGVYVLGGSVAPAFAEVVRAGTNGLPNAGQVVDALLTDIDANRARGIAEIARLAPRAFEDYELPLSDSLGGLIPIGSLVEIGDEQGGSFTGAWRGLVRGVAVRAEASLVDAGGVALTVRQTINVERHDGD